MRRLRTCLLGLAVAGCWHAAPAVAVEGGQPSTPADRTPDEMRRLVCQAAQNAIRARLRAGLASTFENCAETSGVGQSPDGVYVVWGSFGVTTPAGAQPHSYIVRVTYADGAFGVTVLALE